MSVNLASIVSNNVRFALSMSVSLPPWCHWSCTGSSTWYSWSQQEGTARTTSWRKIWSNETLLWRPQRSRRAQLGQSEPKQPKCSLNEVEKDGAEAAMGPWCQW